MIKRFFLIETADDIESIANSVIDDIRRQLGQAASGKWIAGALTAAGSASSKERQRINSMQMGLYDPSPIRPTSEKEIEQEQKKANLLASAKRYETFYKILAKYNLVDVKTSSRGIIDYEISRARDNSKRNDILSRIRAKSEENAATRQSDLKKEKGKVRAANFAVGQDYLDKLIDAGFEESIYKLQDMNALDVAHLKHVHDIQQRAKQSKKNYTAALVDKMINNDAGIVRLNQLGFINNNGMLNNQLIDEFIELFNYDPKLIYNIKPFARDLHDSLEKISSDAAYRENAFTKKLVDSNSPVIKQAEEIAKSLSPIEKEALLADNIRPLKTFVDSGLIKNGELTDLGNAVRISIRRGKDSINDVRQQTIAAIGRDDDSGPLDASHPDTFARSDSNQVKNADIKRRAKETANRFSNWRKTNGK